MTTLIAVYKSGGESGSVCVGRCDAKCYEATCPDCDCICGGMNHGKGLDRATDNTRDYAEVWLEEYHQEKGLDPHKTRSTVAQRCEPTLFDISAFSKAIVA